MNIIAKKSATAAPMKKPAPVPAFFTEVVISDLGEFDLAMHHRRQVGGGLLHELADSRLAGSSAS